MVTKAPDQGGSAVGTQVSAGAHLDAVAPEADDGLSAPWRLLGPDPREATATHRARRQGFALMAASAVFMLALLAGAWLLVRAYL